MTKLTTGYRPEMLKDVIGHARIKRSLHILLTAAQRKQQALPHLLFTGPPGLGKTTFSLVLAREMQAKLVHVHADGMCPADLRKTLTEIEAGSILFIDEVHRLSNQSSEILYGPMEDGIFTLERHIIEVPEFTLVGATTHTGLLPEPLRRRFHHVYSLDFLKPLDLSVVAHYAGWAAGLYLAPEAAAEIGRRSKGAPRRAVHLVSWIGDYTLAQKIDGVLGHAEFRRRPCVSGELAKQALTELGLDARGLDELDRKYLGALKGFNNRPVGVKTIAAFLGEQPETLEREVEPWLARCGLVLLGQRGRELPHRTAPRALRARRPAPARRNPYRVGSDGQV